MNKIVLIYPKFTVDLEFSIPLGLLHLGTFLQSQGYEVKLIDCIIESDYKELIAAEINDAICVGISAMTTQIPRAREASIFIKNYLKSNIPIIFGGAHPTLYPEQTVLDPLVDYVVVGEGELAARNLINTIKNNDLEYAKTIPGIAYRDKFGKPHVNLQTEHFNYSEMPELDYGLLNSKVFDICRKLGTYFPLLTSRGCPFRCAFCINVVTRNTKWRNFSAERTVSEIERLVKMGFYKIWFWDENFYTSKQRIEKILSLLETKNIAIEAWSEGRANYIRENFLNHDLLTRLKNSGFKRMGFGFESGSQRILGYLQKDITVEQILNAAKKCSQAGVRISASFMIGLPTETVDDIKKTVEIIGKLTSICNTCGISGPILYRPYPGSKLYTDCIRAGWQEPKSLQGWSEKAVKDFSARVPSPYELPWIKYPAIVNTVHFYSYTISTSYKNLFLMFKEYCQMTEQRICFFFIGAVGLLFLSAIGKLRYKLGFFRFLIEKNIFYKYHPNLDY